MTGRAGGVPPPICCETPQPRINVRQSRFDPVLVSWKNLPFQNRSVLLSTLDARHWILGLFPRHDHEYRGIFVAG